MSKMGNKLSRALEENINLSAEDVINNFEQLKKQNPEIIEDDFEEIKASIKDFLRYD